MGVLEGLTERMLILLQFFSDSALHQHLALDSGVISFNQRRDVSFDQ